MGCGCITCAGVSPAQDALCYCCTVWPPIARIWELAAPYLAQAGLAPIALDLRGHGLSDKPEGEYSFAEYAADLLGFLNSMDLDKPLLVGHSWGAMVALDYATRYPLGPRARAL